MRIADIFRLGKENGHGGGHSDWRGHGHGDWKGYDYRGDHGSWSEYASWDRWGGHGGRGYCGK
jgi:hypothetical protein